MNARQAASLVLRLIGIYVFVTNLSCLPQALEYFYYAKSQATSVTETRTMMIAYLGGPWLYLTTCIFAIGGSNIIARWLVPDEQAVISASLDVDTIQALAFCAIGLMLLVEAIPRVGSLIVAYATQSEARINSTVSSDLGIIVSLSMKMIIGLYLFFNPRGVGQFVETASGNPGPGIESPGLKRGLRHSLPRACGRLPVLSSSAGCPVP